MVGPGLDASLSSPSDGVLTFNPGSMNGQRQCATFTIIDDDTLEGDENFQVSLDSPTGGANLDEPMSATVTITDNDSRLHNYYTVQLKSSLDNTYVTYYIVYLILL